MLLAQINRDSQGMSEYPGGGGEAQHVTLCLTETVSVTDGDHLENMEGVSLQEVALSDGSTAYIQHTSKEGKLLEGQVVQLEDGSTAYVHHVAMPKNGLVDQLGSHLVEGIPANMGFYVIDKYEDVVHIWLGGYSAVHSSYTRFVRFLVDKLLCKDIKYNLRLEDGQEVQLEDGTTAFIHHTSKDSFDQSALQAVQLEDGTTAYIHHSVQVPQSDAILAIQSDGTVSGLHTGEASIDADTISALEQYAAKKWHVQKRRELCSIVGSAAEVSIEGSEDLNNNGMMGENDQDKKMQIVLQGHVARVTTKTLQTGDKSFRCDFDGCGKLYTTAHHLKVHERSHTGDRPYQCEHNGCGKAFATGYGLKSHVRTHTGEKPYRCSEDNCSKSFKTSGDLQKHVRTHTGERPFKCPFEGCGRSFTTSNIRKVHIRTHTGERPYYCTEPGCGRAFASATNYKNHVRIHTGEKPYVCTVPGCDKRFTEYSSLYKHHVVHTHSKPYNCNHCGKTYKQISTLAMHKRTAHNDTEPIEEDHEAFYEPQPDEDHHIAYVTGVEGEDGISPGINQQVALISQDGTQHVNISQANMHSLGSTITMVTQDGSSFTVPTHDAVISSSGTHSMVTAMVTAEDTDGQQVAIVTQDLSSFHNASSEIGHQHHTHHLLTSENRPVTLLATSNGTQIAVQLGEQQSLEEAIRIASRIQQGESPGIDD